jgi:hypothetical protein
LHQALFDNIGRSIPLMRRSNPVHGNEERDDCGAHGPIVPSRGLLGGDCLCWQVPLFLISAAQKPGPESRYVDFWERERWRGIL